MKKTIFAATLLTVAISACAAPQTPNPGNGLASAGRGLLHLILAPLQIAAGLAEGLASIPYYAATGVHQLNQGLRSAQAKVTLEDTYHSAYGKELKDVGDDGDTGQSFTRMRQASGFFQNVLKQYGIENAQDYHLVSIDTANKDGYTLFAVVYRPQASVQVIDKYNGTQRRFDRGDRLYYEPYARSADGQPLDTVVDWAAVPTQHYRTQKQQAMLLTLAANKVAEGSRRADFWSVEQRWLKGDWQGVVREQDGRVQERLQLKPAG